MFKELQQQYENNEKILHEINFKFKKKLIYHVKKNVRLCISAALKKKIFKLTHDENAHKNQD